MIIRGERATTFTVVNNAILDDENIDWKDLGLLTYLLSKPDHWEVSVAHLVKIRKAGKEAIYNSLRNLKEAGYVTMHRKPEGGADYRVYDTPQPLTGNQKVANPLPENPLSENPLSGNPTQVNTDIEVITEKKEKSDISFDQFYDKYGVKKGKVAAQRAWRRLSAKKQREAYELIDKFKASLEEWRSPPHPSTYLNQERWTDDLTPAPKETGGDGKKVFTEEEKQQREQEARRREAAQERAHAESLVKTLEAAGKHVPRELLIEAGRISEEQHTHH